MNRKIVSTLVALCLFVGLQGQAILHTNPNPVAQVSGGYNAHYQAVLDAMTTDPTGDTLTWQNEMVDSLDYFFGWDERIDWLGVFATTNNGASEALINWIDPGTNNAEVLVSPTWTRLQGYVGDDATDGINTNYNPGTDSINIGRYNLTFGIYNRVDAQDAADALVEAYSETNRYWSARPRNTDNTAAFRINTNLATAIADQTNSSGFYLATRRAVNEQEFYRNGVSLATHTQNSLGLPNANVYLLRYTTYQAAIFIIMDAVSDAEAVILNRIFERYMDHLGTGVE